MRARLPIATLLATLALAAPAAAAVPGVNVSHVNDYGDPYVKSAGNMGDYAHDQGDTARAWQDLQESGAKTVRTFVQWSQLSGATRTQTLDKYVQFAAKAKARGLQVELVVTGDRTSMATPAAYATAIRDLATALKGNVLAYEVWNEEDDTTFWADGPQPAAYAALLKAAHAAVKGADPAAKVLIGGMVANDADFVNGLYDNGARGAFDGAAVHTDTACLTTDPTEYYREPDGRIGRYSFTGYREVRAAMLAHGDDLPVYITEMGWSTTSATCNTGARAGTKPGGVSAAEQATFLTKAFGCLANDAYVPQAYWFNLHDIDSASANYDLQLGLVTDAYARKPAFAAFKAAGGAGAIACGGALDKTAPHVTFAQPTDGGSYIDQLPISVSAEDEQGVRRIQLTVDGAAVPVSMTASGTHAQISRAWSGFKGLAAGRHVLVAKAYDEAKNVGSASVTVTKLAGGSVATKVAMKVGKVAGGKVTVSCKVVPSAAGTTVGRLKLAMDKYDAKHRRWVKAHRADRTARQGFKVTYPVKRGVRYRLTASYTPAAGVAFRASKTPAVALKG